MVRFHVATYVIGRVGLMFFTRCFWLPLIQRTIGGWCSPNAAAIATESPAVNVAPATPCCRGFCRGRPVMPQRYLRGSALRKVCAM